MGQLISDQELSYLRGLNEYLNIPTLTSQQEQMILLYMRGASPTGAAKGAGYKDPYRAAKWLKSDEVQPIIDHIMKRKLDALNVTRESLTQMIFEAHGKAGSATEELNAIDKLAKLHALYPGSPGSGGSSVHVNVNAGAGSQVEITNDKQLQRMTDDDLLKLAGMEMQEAMTPPEPLEIEGDFTRE